MKIDQNRYFWDFFLKCRFKINKSAEPLTPRKIDVVQISYKAKRQLKNEYIENALDSGKPMTGVTYEEYCDYYYDKHGYYDKDNMKREYKQALRGDNIFTQGKGMAHKSRLPCPSTLVCFSGGNGGQRSRI